MGNQTIATINQIMQHGLDCNIIHKKTEDASLNGRTVNIEGKDMINFGSCAYLGLEYHPSLKQGAIDAVQAYGSQFSSSRTYLALGLVNDLEVAMEKIFDQPVIVTPSTTMGHLATLPVIVDDDDAVILDMQVHASVQLSIQLLKARGVVITIIRHNDMDALEKKIKALRAKHKKIWYMADGVYSMYGDFAPMDRLEGMLNKYPEFHLYIDDAHGMGWTGKNGMGYVRSQIEHHERMVMATSMNKSFAAAGGCLIFPNPEMRQKVLNCGGTLIFSGPIQPPMLGVALASSEIHLSDEIESHQQKLAELTAHMNMRLNEAGLPQFMQTDSPLFFVPFGLPKIIAKLIKRIKSDGFWINSASFPATPMKRGGLRFMTNGHLRKEDIDGLVKSIAHHYPIVLAEEKITCNDVARTFRIPEFEVKSQVENPMIQFQLKRGSQLIVNHKTSIGQMDPVEWDAIHAGKGNFTHAALQGIESVFIGQSKKENDWDFHYFNVKDDEGKVILSTFYTAVLVKDDMFASASISKIIEGKRRNDPYFLNSKVVMLGSMITKGEHLFLDRNHQDWKEALKLLIDQMQITVSETNAAQIMFREFYGELDQEFKSTMLELGLTALQLPNNVVLKDLSWEGNEGYLKRIKGRYRSDFRREILKYEDGFRIETAKPKSETELGECYNLYQNVFDRSLEMNVHRLPFEYFQMMNVHDGYDIIRLYLKGDPRPQSEQKPVGVMFSFFEKEVYNAMIVGLDYEFNQSHGVYKQALYQTVKRAHQLGAKDLDLAFTAELVKKKVGAIPQKCWAFIQIMDSYNLQVIDAIGGISKAS